MDEDGVEVDEDGVEDEDNIEEEMRDKMSSIIIIIIIKNYN